MSRPPKAPQTALGRWMVDNNVSDEAMAEKLGIKLGTMKAYRKGENHASLSLALATHDITGIDLYDLVPLRLQNKPRIKPYE